MLSWIRSNIPSEISSGLGFILLLAAHFLIWRKLLLLPPYMEMSNCPRSVLEARRKFFALFVASGDHIHNCAFFVQPWEVAFIATSAFQTAPMWGATSAAGEPAETAPSQDQKGLRCVLGARSANMIHSSYTGHEGIALGKIGLLEVNVGLSLLPCFTMTSSGVSYRRFLWADAKHEDRDTIWQAEGNYREAVGSDVAGNGTLEMQTDQEPTEQISTDDHVCWGGWHSYSDAKSEGTCFLKLIDGDTGAVIEAANSEELRLIALRRAKADDYIRGTLYFLQTRIVPRIDNKRRCKKYAVKWYVDNADIRDRTISYYQ